MVTLALTLTRLLQILFCIVFRHACSLVPHLGTIADHYFLLILHSGTAANQHFRLFCYSLS